MGIFDLLFALDGVIFRSITTNGLLLEGEMMRRLVTVRPDKVHISIHSPHSRPEVERVIRQVGTLGALGIRCGINLLVARSKLEASRAAAATHASRLPGHREGQMRERPTAIHRDGWCASGLSDDRSARRPGDQRHTTPRRLWFPVAAWRKPPPYAAACPCTRRRGARRSARCCRF